MTRVTELSPTLGGPLGRQSCHQLSLSGLVDRFADTLARRDGQRLVMRSFFRTALTPSTVAFMGVVTVVDPASVQSFDEARDQLRGEAVRRGLGESIQSVNAFAAVRGVSAAKFTVGGSDQTSDADIGKISLPLSYQFSDIGIAAVDQPAPDIKGTVALAEPVERILIWIEARVAVFAAPFRLTLVSTIFGRIKSDVARGVGAY